VPDIDETAHVNPSLFRALDAPKGQGAAAPAQQPVLIVSPLQACLFSGACSSFLLGVGIHWKAKNNHFRFSLFSLKDFFWKSDFFTFQKRK